MGRAVVAENSAHGCVSGTRASRANSLLVESQPTSPTIKESGTPELPLADSRYRASDSGAHIILPALPSLRFLRTKIVNSSIRRARSRARISCAIHNLRGRFTVDGRPGRFRGFIARGHPRCLTHRPTPPRKQLGLASKIGRCINKRQRRGNRDGDSAGRGRERERQKSMKNGKAQKRAGGNRSPSRVKEKRERDGICES